MMSCRFGGGIGHLLIMPIAEVRLHVGPRAFGLRSVVPVLACLLCQSEPAHGAAELGDLLLVGEGFAGRFKRLEDFVEHGDVGVDGSPVALLLELLL